MAFGIQMPRVLRDITISEVSSVDKGAGRGVKVLLIKRDGEAMPDGSFKITTEAELRDAITKAATAGDDVKSHVASRAAVLKLDGLIPADWVNPGEVDMTKEEIEKVLKDGITAGVATAIAPIQESLAKAQREVRILKMTAAHKAYMDGCSDEDTKKKFADMEDKDRDAFMDKNPLKKVDAPVVNADLAKRDGEIADLRKSLGEAQSALSAIALEKSQAEFKKQAVAEGLTEADGETMRKAYAGDKEAQATLAKRRVEVVDALKKQVEQGQLFGEFGTRKGQEAGTAMAALNAKADELRKTEAGKNLTKEQAFAKVYEDPANRDLVQQNKQDEMRKRLTVVAA